jgi:hypothetical protein
VPAQDQTPPGDSRGLAVSYGDLDRITNKVEQIRAVDGNADGDSIQPRSSLAAILRLQSTEIERLALENDRLAAHLEAARYRHEDEQTQRRDLERQLREARAGNEPPAPNFDVDEIRRAAREGMSAEIKPVLMAILDLLESTLPRGAETAKAAGPEVAPAPANLVAEVMDDFRRLPEILTRPLEELTGGGGNTGPAPEPIAALPAQVPPQETDMPRPRPPRHDTQPSAQSNARSSAMPSAIPSVFAWTNLFS